MSVKETASDVKTKILRAFNKRAVVQAVFIAFLTASILAPLIAIFFNMTGEGIRATFTSNMFLPALGNSLSTALTATVITVLLAFAASYCTERMGLRATSLWSVLFVIPMLIPSISHAFGLITLFGKNGIITNIFHAKSNLYGFWGIVLGSIMYSFPVAYLMISGILRYEGSMQYKAAKVLGIPAPRRFLAITLPYLKKTLISTFFAVFTMIITDYGVPLTIGGKMSTLSTLMYNTAVANANINVGSVLGVVLLVPAMIAFIFDLLNPENAQNGFVNEPVEANANKWLKVAAYAFCVLISIFILLPVISFCIMSFAEKYPVNMAFTFRHVRDSFTRGAGTFLLNSLLYATLVAAFGTIVGFLCAYATSRLKGRLGQVLHFISMISMAIPGIVLGLAYVVLYHGSAIYGTVIIIVLVNSVHFFSSPYLMIYNALNKMNSNLEDVGLSLGIPRWRIILNVIFPTVLMTVLEMFVYYFVNTMMTISAISFLAPPAPRSIALMINQFEAQLLMESAAFVSLLILSVNFTLKGALAVIKKMHYKRTLRSMNIS